MDAQNFSTIIAEKALPGLVVPLCQWLFRAYRTRGYEHRKKTLREQIADLSKQRASFAELPATPERETAIRDLESELEAAVRELAAVTTSASQARLSQPSDSVALALRAD
jgi:hypothetical protein